MKDMKQAENIIIADGDFLDRVAFDLTVNFERMIGRAIPQADLARWAECAALDGGLREGSEQTTQLVLVHDADSHGLKNFAPGDYDSQLNGQAFNGNLGEFAISAVSTEQLTTKESLMADIVQMALEDKDIRRIVIVPDEDCYNRIRQVAGRADDDSKHITVLAMQPMPGGRFRQEILGYSLMAALGIKGDEIHPD